MATRRNNAAELHGPSENRKGSRLLTLNPGIGPQTLPVASVLVPNVPGIPLAPVNVFDRRCEPRDDARQSNRRLGPVREIARGDP